MTSTDFAAAQQRVLARRQGRTAELQKQRALLRSQRDASAIGRLPFPLHGFAQSGLETWDIVKGREGTRPSFRVGQVDAELLDEELLELLTGQVGEALKLFGSHVRAEWSSEILLALRAVLFKLSIWDHNSSYGASLQNLRYTDARHTGLIPKNPSAWQKSIYGLFTVGGRYAWGKWEQWLIDQQGGYGEPAPMIRILSQASSLASTTHSVAAFLSFLVFLVNGRYRTLLDRVLRLRLAPPASQVRRQVNFEYLNRQLVWHAFTEFLLFVLPLVGISRWKRWLATAWRKMKLMVRQGEHDEDDSIGGELAFLPERTCAICYQDQNQNQNQYSNSPDEMLAISATSAGIIGSAQTDITNPYEIIPCRCIYCFVCIATRLEAEEGEGWVCLRCGEVVKECRPWNGDVLEVASQVSSSKSVTFSNYDTRDKTKGLR